MTTTFDPNSFDIRKFDSILARGLSNGLGERGGKMCIEAAICAVLDLPHGDDPKCVANAVRHFKIRLNDSRWSSDKARANGLRDLGLAQLSSLGIVVDRVFSQRLAEKTIRVLLPDLFRRYGKPEFDAAADRCEREGTHEAARHARSVAAAYAADAAAYAADAAAYAADAYAADAYAAYAAYDAYAYAAKWKLPPDYYLLMIARLALEVLVELKSPGVVLLNK